jgi:hypothetical protein
VDEGIVGLIARLSQIDCSLPPDSGRGAEDHVLDFPLQVGEPPLISPIEVMARIVLVVLLTVDVAHYRRLMTAKIRGVHEKPTGI